MSGLSELPPLSLYIHFPWCVQKCPYCDFNSHAVKDGIPEREYVRALVLDVEQHLPAIWGRSVQSIFIGGGTPSLLSPEALDELMTALRARLNLKPAIEVTLEANPGTLETGKFSEFRAVGVNRLSIGVQSFNDDHLRRLGRIHQRRQAIRAAESAHDAGFTTFNLDLMFGLPTQTIEESLRDIRTAMDLEPTHISHYQLTIEPNTLFYKQPPTLPDDDRCWAMQEQCQRELAERGFHHYEISAYAKAKHECKHNLNYWQFGDYLGIGAGAHGKLSNAAEQTITRHWKHKHPQDYLQILENKSVTAGEKVLAQDDLIIEFMMNALRLTQGFESALFSRHTGLPIEIIHPQLERAMDQGWLDVTDSAIRPTQRGLLFLNDLLALFVEDE
ncbi:MAG: radical SAM family heme chaperone HemW [Gammaproteobacteria bacterium]|nr:radical SAM family heme chaperone HemW [Gammaproteobacteria bacterium]MDH5653165.1 radical SAM family heme chaperone HemW [Gammaproteobacteria bacterium]